MSFRPDGRWGGKLTSRALPHGDPTVDALTDAERAELVEVWLGRAASERRVADSFGVVREALVDLGADATLVGLAERAMDDEMRHAEISRFVASRYADRELEAPPLLPLTVPRHKEASDELRRTLHIVGQCAFNETFASTFLEASIGAATAPMARSALRELFSDEIDHARVGWAHLAACSAEVRSEVGRWLPSMARANLKMWRDAPRAYPEEPRLHQQGAPSASMVEFALLSALRDLIVPGLEAVGLPTGALRLWVAQGAPTHDRHGTT